MKPSALLLFLLSSCSNDEAPVATGQLHQRPVELPVDAGTPGPGCETIRVTTTPTGCAATWQCESPEPRNFLCERGPKGVVCACAEGDAAVQVTTDAGCTGDADVHDLAHRLCGWEVQ